MNRLLLLCLALVVIVCGSIRESIAKDANSKNTTLLDATSPYEDLAEAALAKNRKLVLKTLASAESQVAVVTKALPASTVSSYKNLLESIRAAAKAEQYQTLAMHAVEMFRLLIDGLDSATLDVPKEISLLDYVGFRLHVLAAAPEPNWESIQTTVADASKWWSAIKGKVKDKSLRDAMHSTILGLQQAAASKNLPMLNFAAQVDLDLVDLLEADFEK